MLSKLTKVQEPDLQNLSKVYKMPIYTREDKLI